MSPLKAYLKSHNLRDGELAHAAEVSRALVTAVAAGDMPLQGKLRVTLDQIAPGVAEKHDDWVAKHRREIKRRLGVAA